MSNFDRKIEIVRRLSDKEVTKVSDLAEFYYVTESTIRRDLLALEEQGLIKRTHGGVLLNSKNLDLNYSYRSNCYSKQKEAIARFAASLIKDDDVIAMNTSTTVDRIAKYITASNVTVITNSYEVIKTLEDRKDIVLICIGGVYYNNHRSFEGTFTDEAFSKYNYRLSFIGVNGLDDKYGISTKTEIEASTKQTIINNSVYSVVAAESAKFGKTFKNKVFPLDRISCIITDDGIDEKTLKKYQKKYKIMTAATDH